MILTRLIQEAIKADPEFAEKMAYWVHKRKKVPDTEWLEGHILRILGPQKIEEIMKSVKK